MPTFLKSILRTSRWTSYAMLVSLHLALWLGMHDILMHPVLLMHLGLFLMWQPLWRGGDRLHVAGVLSIVAVSLVVLFWLSWWLVALWVSVLFALVGGRVFAFHARWQRIYYLLVMAYLLAINVLYITPHLFGLQGLHEVMEGMMHVGLPLLLVLMALIPQEKEQAEGEQAVDFIYILLLFALLVSLLLGSLAFMTLAHVDYLRALTNTLALIGGLLLLLGLLWNPRLGFSGFQAMFSRYLLNIGTPLEAWLEQLARAAQQEHDPEAFLNKAAGQLVQMPWLSGMSWVSEYGHDTLGLDSPHRIELAEQGVKLVLFCRQSPTPSMTLHINLLGRLLGYFYQAKCREQHLREIARQQAVYETGARLTHDLKNVMQSLFALTSVAQHQPEKAQPVLQRQLPILTQRIEMLLGKLKTPQLEEEQNELSVAAWWEGLRHRHRHRGLIWHVRGTLGNQRVPAALFDSVADNLIENASRKRQQEPDISIEIILNAEPLWLEVVDSGHAVPAEISARLLHTIVPSEQGLGIGLYQVSRWAIQMGYRLGLSENRNGKVVFRLEGRRE